GAEHDPGAVFARDQQRVLPVEADPRARRSLAVDVLVRVDEYAVVAAEPAPELVQLLAQLRVVVRPGVTRQAALPRSGLASGVPVTERGRDDSAGVLEQGLRVARHLGPRHREAHVREQAALPSLANVTLRLFVGLGARGADDVEAELARKAVQL